LITDINTAIKGQDFMQLKDLFHRLKGSAGNCGIMSMHALGLKAEESVKQSDWNAVEESVKLLAETFSHVKLEINNKFS
jgi:HPt (histidine-containing phosphotransfer) domain-containing protein